jgi:heme-degrading monooxygenase HmoA
MFVVLYRWKINAGMKEQFIDAWSERTAFIRENYESLGSRLHRGNDGLFYGYAQWKSAEQREKAFQVRNDSEAGKRMSEAIAETLPEIILETLTDFLVQSENKSNLRLPK